jgi:SlyX protein
MTDHPEFRRFIELETRLAFQERTLQELSDTVARQQTEIDRLTRVLKETQERLRGISQPIEEQSKEPPPPHY